MLFTTDQQTTRDLNIFGKHTDQSVYALFDRAFTRGGAALLKEMFLYPLSDAAAINKRCSVIRYFSTVKAFPFDASYFDTADQYLANTDERTKLSHSGGSVIKKLGSLIAEDPDYKFIHTGVLSLIGIINSLSEFTATMLHDIGNVPYREELDAIRNTLAGPPFEGLPKETAKSKISYADIADLDVCFRFRYREELKKMLRYCYQLDVYISVGRMAAERGYTYPVAMGPETNILSLEGVYHPQLNRPVANDFGMGPGRNLVFLTGANMAGKSTFMKSVGIAMYLAHMGFPVPAKRMEFSVRDGIYTTINLPDNLGMGASHFYAEVLRVKKIARELSLGKRLFVMFDELFRGTNVKDAHEATIAVTAAFAGKKSSMFIISTHIIEAGEVLREQCPNVGFNFLPTRMNNNEPVYTYLLEQGISADRHGMVIINNEGIIELLKKGKGGAV